MSAKTISRLRFSAGHIKTAGDLKTDFGSKLLRSPIVAFTVGSITWNERPGNPEPHYGYDSETGTSYNAVGLKNPGFEKFYLGTELSGIIKLAFDFNKEIIISLAPLTPNEVRQMAHVLSGSARKYISRIQLNGGCPNVSGHSVIAHDPLAIKALFEEVKDFTSTIVFEFKTSPGLSQETLRHTVELCAEYGIKWIVSANTEKVNTPLNSQGKPYTGSPACGMAGVPLFEKNVSQLIAFSDVIQKLGADIKLVACGGISTAKHLTICAEAGATEAEMMTAVLENGPKIFQDILMETE